MFKIEFDAPDLNSLVKRAVQQHITSALAGVVCPAHHSRLEAVHIAGETPDRLQIKMRGCCDEILAVANRALGAVDEVDSEQLGEDADNGSAGGTNEDVMTEQRSRAFICHASEDRELAQRLATDLHAAGIDTFFDQWEMTAGVSLRRKIDEGIASCTHFIVLLTPASLEKPWVNAELDAGFVNKVSGRAVLIPLRHELPVDRLPPLLAALLSPEIRDYEQDVKTLINDIRGLTRKPPVTNVPKQTPSWGPNLALSPLAASLAELFSKRSEDGRSWDPQLQVEEMKEATGASDDDLIDAVSELEEMGWVEPQRVMGAAPYGYTFVTPTDRLFEHVDPNVMGWRPSEDALRIAAEVVNSDDRGLQAHELAERLGWTARRVNPALSYLVSHDLVLSSRVNDPVYVTHYVGETPKTRRFVRNAP